MFQARDHLKTISPDVNAKILEEIESSILYVVLNDSEPETEEDLVRLAMAGCETYRDVFADKSWVRVVTKNGLYVSQSEVSEMLLDIPFFFNFASTNENRHPSDHIYFFSILAMTGWQPLILAPS